MAGEPDLGAIEDAIRKMLEAKREEIIEDARFVYEGDTLAGPRRRIDADTWIIGQWFLEGTPPILRARVEKRFSSTGGEWEAEVVEAMIDLRNKDNPIVSCKAYTAWGSAEG